MLGGVTLCYHRGRFKNHPSYTRAVAPLTRYREKMADPRQQDNLNRKVEQLVTEMCTRDIRLPLAVREFEKKFLQVVLSRCGGNRTRAARMLGIHRNTLAHKIDSHGL